MSLSKFFPRSITITVSLADDARFPGYRLRWIVFNIIPSKHCVLAKLVFGMMRVRSQTNYIFLKKFHLK